MGIWFRQNRRDSFKTPLVPATAVGTAKLPHPSVDPLHEIGSTHARQVLTAIPASVLGLPNLTRVDFSHPASDPPMTPHQFIAKWKPADLKERAACRRLQQFHR